VPAHLAHGDLLGNCEAGSIITKAESTTEQDKKVHAVIIYPNPANNKAYLSINPAQDEQVNISIYDMNGKKVTQPAYKGLKAGNQLIELNTTRFANGVYFVQLSGSVSKSTLKLVVLH
jgi:hypothetical protein